MIVDQLITILVAKGNCSCVPCVNLGVTEKQLSNPMTRSQLLDLYFLNARARLIDLAAFLDRVERADGEADFRLDALRQAMKELSNPGSDRTERILKTLSDPTTDPAPLASSKGACGAWPGPVA